MNFDRFISISTRAKNFGIGSGSKTVSEVFKIRACELNYVFAKCHHGWLIIRQANEAPPELRFRPSAPDMAHG